MEGGGSTLYGSGSIGGVINIISTQPRTTAAVLATGSFGEQTYQFQTPYVSFQRTYATNDYGLPDDHQQTPTRDSRPCAQLTDTKLVWSTSHSAVISVRKAYACRVPSICVDHKLAIHEYKRSSPSG